ncbi:hypothetical protein P171DRAFT_479224 [Karstenula rhodostoma CBS 690.94]|uniref:Protein kinase domain-containing protein n=1 Tax=Karstenula rhodostoma CBS 690.94 TaxID=1392251 RepID=A0A9P4PZU5_9PLEO|nr:hypothetical protein P171DRAFT_479224 [Karstenula rhodostoma CBS 690.94]
MDALDQFSPSDIQMEELAFDEVEHPAPSHPKTGNPGSPSIRWVDMSWEGTYNTEATRQDLETMGITWNAEVQDIEKTIRPANPVPGVPPFYLEVLEAGSGVFGTVVLCLPRPHAIAARYRHAQGKPQDVAELKSKLVAVKVMKSIHVKKSQDELRVNEILLRNIRSATATTVPRFATLRGQCEVVAVPKHQTTDHVQPWLALDSIVPSLTVDDLLEKHVYMLEGIAEILILHIFCGVMDAIRFLHSCSPPITHQDIHNGNVMLELTDGLPRVVLNDFDTSDIVSKDYERFDFDFECLCWMMRDFYTDVRDAGVLNDHSNFIPSKRWIEFNNTVLISAAQASSELMKKLAEPLARSILENLPAGGKSQVAECLCRASGPQEVKLLTHFKRMDLLPSTDLGRMSDA